jgi:capsular polysaccharide biosynthesis protein
MSAQTDQRDGDEQRLLELTPGEGAPPAGEQVSLGAAIRRHRRLVLAPVALLLFLALCVGLLRTPTYTADTRLAVGGLSATDPVSLTGFADAAQQLAQTYSRSIQGDKVVAEVAQQTGQSQRQVRSHLAAATIPETPVFTVKGTSDSPGDAIELSRLASEALVAEADRATQEDPAQLLQEYRDAEIALDDAQRRVESVALTGGEALATARADVLAAEARAETVKTAYEASQRSGPVALQILQKADQASSDRLSRIQLMAFAAVLVGLLLGMALAVFRDSPLYQAYGKPMAARAKAAREVPLRPKARTPAGAERASVSRSRRRRKRALRKDRETRVDREQSPERSAQRARS